MSNNVGVGIGAFLNGLSNGAKVYSDIASAAQMRDIRGMQLQDLKQDFGDKQEYRSILKNGDEQANSARNADIDAKIQTSTQEGPPSYKVGDQQFADPDAARGAAEKQVGGYMDYWKKTVAPKMQDHWMKIGQVDKAQNFTKWLEDQDVQEGMKSWANMARSYSIGDKPGFLENLNATLSHSKYYQGNVKPVSAAETFDDQGQMTGYKVTFKDQSTGKESTQDFTGNDVQKLMVTASSPAQVYAAQVDEMNATKNLRAKVAEKVDNRNYETQKAETAQGYALEKDSNSSKLRLAEEAEKKRLGLGNDPMAKVKAAEGYLKSRGYTDDYISSQAPALLGIQNQNKPISNRIEEYVKTQMENSREFRKLSKEEQVKQANEYIEIVDGLSQAGGGRSIFPAQQNQQPAQAQGKGIPVFDNATQKIVYR